VGQHDDLEFFRRSRPEPKADQLEDTLNHDVAEGITGSARPEVVELAVPLVLSLSKDERSAGGLTNAR
jgi:hypothetical protein